MLTITFIVYFLLLVPFLTVIFPVFELIVSLLLLEVPVNLIVPLKLLTEIGAIVFACFLRSRSFKVFFETVILGF